MPSEAACTDAQREGGSFFLTGVPVTALYVPGKVAPGTHGP